MAAYSELEIEQYADFSTTITVQDINGNALNLASYNVVSEMKRSSYSKNVYPFETIVLDDSNGVIGISMSASNTANLPFGRLLYDCNIYDSNTTIRVVEGIVTILPGITRNV